MTKYPQDGDMQAGYPYVMPAAARGPQGGSGYSGRGTSGYSAPILGPSGYSGSGTSGYSGSGTSGYSGYSGISGF